MRPPRFVLRQDLLFPWILARDLGMTHDQLMRQMTNDELLMWTAVYRAEAQIQAEAQAAAERGAR